MLKIMGIAFISMLLSKFTELVNYKLIKFSRGYEVNQYAIIRHNRISALQFREYLRFNRTLMVKPLNLGPASSISMQK